tara:strand:- start:7604 stop:7858 length:255 start_codon:yes stop_codon:yes gene_type:complete
LLIATELGFDELKESLKEIEIELKREKTENKAGPRTIDLDIAVWNSELKDKHVLEWDFLKNSVKELLPELESLVGKTIEWQNNL